MIHVAHLTRHFGSFVAVDDVSFDIERGEVVGFLGPNGAGKTTTLRILAGYLPASSGGVRIAGFDVARQSLEVRQRIGYLPESVPLYREHRVLEMLAFQARLHGLSRDEQRRRIPAVLERVGLRDRARDLIGSLSRGLRQRVGLALALLPEPEVLILDEPTSGLDPLQRLEVRNLVRELAEQHTVILSSHILPEIEAVARRVIIIDRGRIAADGTPAQLVTRLAHASFVRLEAFVGADVAQATRLLSGIRGVARVIDRGRLGVHHQFDVECAEDLREDIGALAAARGWALRELSWRRPTLEEIFARIALGLAAADPGSTRAEAATAAVSAHRPSAPDMAVQLDLGPRAARTPSPSAAVPQAAPQSAPESAPRSPPAKSSSKVVYNLNPFDMGAARELGRPKAIEPPASPDWPPASTHDDPSA